MDQIAYPVGAVLVGIRQPICDHICKGRPIEVGGDNVDGDELGPPRHSSNAPGVAVAPACMKGSNKEP